MRKMLALAAVAVLVLAVSGTPPGVLPTEPSATVTATGTTTATVVAVPAPSSGIAVLDEDGRSVVDLGQVERDQAVRDQAVRDRAQARAAAAAAATASSVAVPPAPPAPDPALEQARAAEEARAAEAAAAAARAQVVSQVQSALLALGYTGVGTADGIAGRRTTTAIRTFQAEAGYPVTGEAGAGVLAQLQEKAGAGWARPAPPARPAAPARPGVSTTVTPGPAPAAPAPTWTTYVANSGSQAAIDACTGGLTAFHGEDGHAYFSVPYLTVHNNCGGAPILDLRAGDTVAISGGGLDGTYQVVDSRDVAQGSTTDAVRGVSGGILLQTCYFGSTTMRIVGATKIS